MITRSPGSPESRVVNTITRSTANKYEPCVRSRNRCRCSDALRLENLLLVRGRIDLLEMLLSVGLDVVGVVTRYSFVAGRDGMKHCHCWLSDIAADHRDHGGRGQSIAQVHRD